MKRGVGLVIAASLCTAPASAAPPATDHAKQMHELKQSFGPQDRSRRARDV